MASRSTLFNRIDLLERQLRERDLADAARKAAAIELRHHAVSHLLSLGLTADQQAATRAAAKLAEAQTMRRNAWINHLLVTAPLGKPLDVAGIESNIPAAPDVWPPGFDSSLVVFWTTKTETPQSVAVTTLGKLMGESK